MWFEGDEIEEDQVQDNKWDGNIEEGGTVEDVPDLFDERG